MYFGTRTSRMAVFHRGLFTWFIIAVFLILLSLRLEDRTGWNWFIVFIPVWLYDIILLIYVIFHLTSHCKHDTEGTSLNSHIWYIIAVILKMVAQIMLCLKLQYKLNLTIYQVMIPVWILFPIMVVGVTHKLYKTT